MSSEGQPLNRRGSFFKEVPFRQTKESDEGSIHNGQGHYRKASTGSAFSTYHRSREPSLEETLLKTLLGDFSHLKKNTNSKQRTLDSYAVRERDPLTQSDELKNLPSISTRDKTLATRTSSHRSMKSNKSGQDGDDAIRDYALNALLISTSSERGRHASKGSIGSIDDEIWNVNSITEIQNEPDETTGTEPPRPGSHQRRSPSKLESGLQSTGNSSSGRGSPDTKSGLEEELNSTSLTEEERRLALNVLLGGEGYRKLPMVKRKSTVEIPDATGRVPSDDIGATSLTEEERRLALNVLLGGEGYRKLPMVKRKSTVEIPDATGRVPSDDIGATSLTEEERRLALNASLGGEGYRKLPMVKRKSSDHLSHCVASETNLAQLERHRIISNESRVEEEDRVSALPERDMTHVHENRSPKPVLRIASFNYHQTASPAQHNNATSLSLFDVIKPAKKMHQQSMAPEVSKEDKWSREMKDVHYDSFFLRYTVGDKGEVRRKAWQAEKRSQSPNYPAVESIRRSSLGSRRQSVSPSQRHRRRSSIMVPQSLDFTDGPDEPVVKELQWKDILDENFENLGEDEQAEILSGMDRDSLGLLLGESYERLPKMTKKNRRLYEQGVEYRKRIFMKEVVNIREVQNHESEEIKKIQQIRYVLGPGFNQLPRETAPRHHFLEEVLGREYVPLGDMNSRDRRACMELLDRSTRTRGDLEDVYDLLSKAASDAIEQFGTEQSKDSSLVQENEVMLSILGETWSVLKGDYGVMAQEFAQKYAVEPSINAGLRQAEMKERYDGLTDQEMAAKDFFDHQLLPSIEAATFALDTLLGAGWQSLKGNAKRKQRAALVEVLGTGVELSWKKDGMREPKPLQPRRGEEIRALLTSFQTVHEKSKAATAVRTVNAISYGAKKASKKVGPRSLITKLASYDLNLQDIYGFMNYYESLDVQKKPPKRRDPLKRSIYPEVRRSTVPWLYPEKPKKAKGKKSFLLKSKPSICSDGATHSNKNVMPVDESTSLSIGGSEGSASFGYERIGNSTSFCMSEGSESLAGSALPESQMHDESAERIQSEPIEGKSSFRHKRGVSFMLSHSAEIDQLTTPNEEPHRNNSTPLKGILRVAPASDTISQIVKVDTDDDDIAATNSQDEKKTRVDTKDEESDKVDKKDDDMSSNDGSSSDDQSSATSTDGDGGSSSRSEQSEVPSNEDVVDASRGEATGTRRTPSDHTLPVDECKNYDLSDADAVKESAELAIHLEGIASEFKRNDRVVNEMIDDADTISSVKIATDDVKEDVACGEHPNEIDRDFSAPSDDELESSTIYSVSSLGNDSLDLEPLVGSAVKKKDKSEEFNATSLTTDLSVIAKSREFRSAKERDFWTNVVLGGEKSHVNFADKLMTRQFDERTELYEDDRAARKEKREERTQEAKERDRLNAYRSDGPYGANQDLLDDEDREAAERFKFDPFELLLGDGYRDFVKGDKRTKDSNELEEGQDTVFHGIYGNLPKLPAEKKVRLKKGWGKSLPKWEVYKTLHSVASESSLTENSMGDKKLLRTPSGSNIKSNELKSSIGRPLTGGNHVVDLLWKDHPFLPKLLGTWKGIFYLVGDSGTKWTDTLQTTTEIEADFSAGVIRQRMSIRDMRRHNIKNYLATVTRTVVYYPKEPGVWGIKTTDPFLRELELTAKEIDHDCIVLYAIPYDNPGQTIFCETITRSGPHTLCRTTVNFDESGQRFEGGSVAEEKRTETRSATETAVAGYQALRRDKWWKKKTSN